MSTEGRSAQLPPTIKLSPASQGAITGLSAAYSMRAACRRLLAQDWLEGPLPWPVLGHPDAAVADGQNRRTYLGDTLGATLYGSDDQWSCLRFHLQPTSSSVHIGPLTLVGTELLILPALTSETAFQRTIVIQHWGVETVGTIQDGVDALRRTLGISHRGPAEPITNPQSSVALQQLFPDDSSRYGRRPYIILQAVGEPTPADLLAMATLTPTATRPPSPDELDMAQRDALRPSLDWQLLVRRDGAAFVGRPGGEAFAPFLTQYVRSIYLDVMLASLTCARLNSLVAAKATALMVADTPAELSAVSAVDRDATLVRSAFAVGRTLHSPHATLVAKAIAEQLNLIADVAQTSENVSDLVRYATLLEDGRNAQQSARTNAALGFLAVVGLPISSALAVWQGIDATPAGLGIALPAGCLLSLALIAAFPGLRRSIREIL